MIAALAVVIAGLMPLAHVHEADGQPLIHRHLIEVDSAHHEGEGDDHHASFDHAGHADATVLTLSYDHGRRFAHLGFPVALTGATVEPDAIGARPTARRSLLPTHDPPRRFCSSPAPPALV
ncbi:MAG: hypothetical protein Q8O42_06650 [Acidobacteriota bacterium]|nr:hypothetical protein [Acidobacteriota bacterium]